MKNLEIKSILRDIVKEVEQTSNLESAKLLIAQKINNSNIDKEDALKIWRDTTYSKTHLDLVKYLYNSILAYEGCRVISKSLNGGKLR